MVKENSISLDNFTLQDAEKTFLWLQDNSLRELFAMQDKPNWERHLDYFKKTLNDPTQSVYKINYNDKHIGNCGFKYITKHMMFVASRAEESEKYWQFLLNLKEAIALKKLREEIEGMQKQGITEGVQEKIDDFNKRVKIFDVSNSENVIRAKQDKTEWVDFYHFVQVLDVVEQTVGIKEDENNKNKPRNTNALKSAILKWNENGANLAEMTINVHNEQMAAFGLKPLKVEITAGKEIKAKVLDGKVYVGQDALIENKNLALLKLLMAGYHIKSLSLINKSISKLSAVDKACVLNLCLQINTAIKNQTQIVDSPQLKELLKFKSAQLMLKLGDANQKQFASVVLGQIKHINLEFPNGAGIVEEYVASKMENLQEEVNKQIVTGKNLN